MQLWRVAVFSSPLDTHSSSEEAEASSEEELELNLVFAQGGCSGGGGTFPGQSCLPQLQVSTTVFSQEREIHPFLPFCWQEEKALKPPAMNPC